MNESRRPTTSATNATPTGAGRLAELLDRAEREGFDTEFDVSDEPSDLDRIRCAVCHHDIAAGSVERVWSQRLEGASDPADMLHVSALTCPNCGAGGVFVSPFGPNASARQAAVLSSLPE